MSAKAPAKGHTAKHAAASKKNAKHATTAKSGTKHAPAKQKPPVTAKQKPPAKVTAKAAPAKPAKPAGFAVGDLLPVCAFEAVAMSLRLAGQPVHDHEVAHLWELLGEPEEGVPVGDALEAVARFGLAGCRPAEVNYLAGPVLAARDSLCRFGFSESDRAELHPGNIHGGHQPQDGGFEGHRQAEHLVSPDSALSALDLAHGLRYPSIKTEPAHALADIPLGDVTSGASGADIRCEDIAKVRHELNSCTSNLILHVDAPGSHAVLATPRGWWSWGELYDPWRCRVSEAWAVSWS